MVGKVRIENVKTGDLVRRKPTEPWQEVIERGRLHSTGLPTKYVVVTNAWRTRRKIGSTLFILS